EAFLAGEDSPAACLVVLAATCCPAVQLGGQFAEIIPPAQRVHVRRADEHAEGPTDGRAIPRVPNRRPQSPCQNPTGPTVPPTRRSPRDSERTPSAGQASPL